MDIEREFHMTDYARNSSVQKKASDKTKHITLETVQQLYKETRSKSLKIADLGCSSGPNTLSTIRDIIKAVKFAHHLEIPNQPLPEFSIFLNDLPSNDFNSIFKSLPDFHTELKRDTNYGDCPSVFIAANPGSFNGRLFPELEKLEMIEVANKWGKEDGISAGLVFAKTVRASQGSMLAQHFGEKILDKIPITLVVVLKRKL
ncbi:unnamed protein product [Brassica rapa subsp. trilocularis]